MYICKCWNECCLSWSGGQHSIWTLNHARISIRILENDLEAKTFMDISLLFSFFFGKWEIQIVPVSNYLLSWRLLWESLFNIRLPDTIFFRTHPGTRVAIVVSPAEFRTTSIYFWSHCYRSYYVYHKACFLKSFLRFNLYIVRWMSVCAVYHLSVADFWRQ